MFRILVFAVMVFAVADVQGQQSRSDRIPLFIVDGQNNHDWPRATRILKDQGRDPGHGPEHDFQVTILDTNHPITKGLPKKWMHPHEQLTHGQHGPAHNLTVLTYAWSKDVKENEPMDWVVSYGKGRVYTTMLGHLWKVGPDTALRCVGFRTLVVRACQWAATGEVTYPVPQDFPTADKVALAEARLPLEVVKAGKPTDRIEVRQEGENVLLEVWSPSGIGSAAIAPRDGKWPNVVVLRLHLRGLESLVVTSDKVKLNGFVLSHSGNTRHLHLSIEGKEREPGTEFRVLDAAGKPIQGLPDKDGYFELVLPKVMLEGQPKRVDLEWIDFYRR